MRCPLSLPAGPSRVHTFRSRAGSRRRYCRCASRAHNISSAASMSRTGSRRMRRTTRPTTPIPRPRPTTSRHIARLGFDNVRLSIDATPLEQASARSRGLNATSSTRLDRALSIRFLPTAWPCRSTCIPRRRTNRAIRTNNTARRSPRDALAQASPRTTPAAIPSASSSRS